jgi:hypothetical protein
MHKGILLKSNCCSYVPFQQPECHGISIPMPLTGEDFFKDYEFVRKGEKNEVYSEATPGSSRSKARKNLIINE